MQQRGNFGTKLGVLMATVGSAVGLGNIWRFPFETGRNGGSAFILIYLTCVLLLGIPAMLAEFSIGRRTQSNPEGAFLKLAPGTGWRWVGVLGVLTGLLINGFYCVVSGWTFSYFVKSLTGSLFTYATGDYGVIFSQLAAGTWEPIAWMLLVMVVACGIIASGVQQGIEKMARVLMPLLFVLLLVLDIRAFFLPGAKQGIDFLLWPDFTKVTANTILSAMGQAFFSLSVGMGCLITYSSYFKKEVHLERTAYQVAGLDTLVAIMAGLVVFPAVFSYGIEPSAGPSLVFITMPQVFQGMPLPQVWSSLFYLLLSIAALTSLISLYEVVVAFVCEKFGFKRHGAAFVVGALIVCMGVFASLSQGPLQGVQLFGKNLLDFLDFLTSTICLPLGGIFTTAFVGWRMDRRILTEELTNQGTLRVRMLQVYVFLMKYVAPIGISCIFIYNLFF